MAQSLGLQPIEGDKVTGCNYLVKVDEKTAYCLDGVVDSQEEAFELGHRITGQELSDLERELYELSQEVSGFPESDKITAEQRAVLERIGVLLQEIQKRHS